MPNRQTQLDTARRLLQSPCRCLLLGANGAGMVALADILTDAGHHIVRMDSSVDANAPQAVHANPFLQPTLQPTSVLAWNLASVPADVDICVATAAVPADDVVMQHVSSNGYPVISLHECLSLLFASRRQICVAGTHGKSTTSAMLACILDHNNYEPGFFVGAVMPDFGRSGRFSDGEWCVLESCEFRESFRNLQPGITVLTGIERDHFDYFQTQASEDLAFHNFTSTTQPEGAVVYPASCLRSRAAVGDVSSSKITFAVEGDAFADAAPNWLATDIHQAGRQTTFTCHGPEGRQTVRLQIPGRHNASNAVAAIAAASSIGIPATASASALSRFSGIERRFQMRGDYGGVTLIDDYAHHPTAIRETLAAVRQSFPGRRILAAFEPHQISRTQALFSDFVASLTDADEAWLLPVFPARENATHLECCRLSGQLVKEVNRNGTKAFLFANLDQIASRIDHSGRPNDILLTMGAGRTNLIHDQLTRRLQRHSVA